MDGTQVKELIQRWRVLSNELKERNNDLEKSRDALHALDKEHAQSVRQWDSEKESITMTIAGILEQVTSKQEELQRIEQESADLQRKVDERRARNEEHARVLRARKEAVQGQLKDAAARDAAAQQRLDAFAQARSETQQQLLAALAKVEAALPRERDEHERRTQELRRRIDEVTAAIDAEEEAWAYAQNERALADKKYEYAVLCDEAAAAEQSQTTWATLLHDTQSLSVQVDLLRQLDELRTSLAV